MAEQLWTVQIGVVDDPQNTGVPPVPTDVFHGDEDGARAEYAKQSDMADESHYRYVLLKNLGDVIECWGTPPAVG